MTASTLLDIESVRRAVADRTENPEPPLQDLEVRLGRLLQFFEGEAGLDDSGRRSAFDSVVELLVQRTRVLADRDRYPEIVQEKIEQPIFVAGVGRSGTTLMHSLCAAHPDRRALEYWELSRPSPPPGISTDIESRISAADAEIRQMIEIQPNLLQFHPYYDQLSHTLTECEWFGAMNLQNMYSMAYGSVPAILTSGLGGSAVEWYEWQYKMLQHLQWRRTPHLWALKSPHHHARLDGLKTVFPDAVVVWVHRDPLKTMPSMLELRCSRLEAMAGAPIDRATVGRSILELVLRELDAGMKSKFVDDDSVHHLQYRDFMADPIGQVQSVFVASGMRWDDDAERSIRAWLDDPANVGTRHGRASYSLEPFGLTPSDIDEMFSAYREKFNIPYE